MWSAKAIQHELNGSGIFMVYAFVFGALNRWDFATALFFSSWAYSLHIVLVDQRRSCSRDGRRSRMIETKGKGGFKLSKAALKEASERAENWWIRSPAAILKKSQGLSLNGKIFVRQAIHHELNRLWPTGFLAWHAVLQFSHDW